MCAQTCFAGLSKVFPNNITALAALKQRMLHDLTRAVAEARGVDASAINTTAQWWAGVKGRQPALPRAILSDPAFLRWQVAIVRVLSRYMVRADNMHAAVPCPGAPWSDVALTADDLPLPACANLSDVALIEGVGRAGQPQEALQTIVNVAVNYGLCTVPARDGFASYGDFMMARCAWRVMARGATQLSRGRPWQRGQTTGRVGAPGTAQQCMLDHTAHAPHTAPLLTALHPRHAPASCVSCAG